MRRYVNVADIKIMVENAIVISQPVFIIGLRLHYVLSSTLSMHTISCLLNRDDFVKLYY